MTNREEINAKLIQIFTEECVEVFNRGGCIIHFPEIEIFNENGTNRTIYDLYVKLVWTYGNQEESTDKVTSFTTAMYGSRTTFTVEDVWNNYAHSHLSSLEREGPNSEGDTYAYPKFTEFCLGDDTVYNTLAELNMGFNMDKFTILLNSIDDFVRWESLSGGPYVLIEELTTGSAELTEVKATDDIALLETKEIVDLFIIHATDEDIEVLDFIHDEKGTTIPRTNKLLEMWEAFAITQDKVLKSSLPIIKFEDKYYQQNQTYQEMLDLANNLLWGDNIKFKGNNVENKINFSDSSINATEIEEKGQKAPHPSIFEIFIVALESKLNRYLTKTDTWELKKQPVI